MIKPLKSLLLLIYIILFLGLLTFLPDEISLAGNQVLKIPKITSLFENKKVEYADISDIQNKFSKDKKIKPVKNDSTKKEKNHKIYVPDTLKLKPELRIQFPKNHDDALKGFFQALRKLDSEDELIRVVHFGDSQLEGDRITAFLREKFQQQFGGCGIGIANMVDKLNSKVSIAQSASPSWVQQVVYGPKYNRNNPGFYGLLGDYYKFQVPEEPTWTKASVTYTKSPYATPYQQKVENVKVLYRNPDAPFELSIQTPSGEEVKTKIEESESFGVYEHKLRQSFENVTVSFATGSKSPEIYGVALDCNKGITFDNVPLRGSSGVEFTRVNKAHLKRQFEKLHVKFLILQFGVNIVPNPLPDYGFYETMFYNQLQYFKSIDPDLSILVVGVSVMSRNMRGTYESYPNIEKIRDAQKNAAFKAGCAFWDLYEAMGGKNSMPSWVFAKPAALANKDFTHFTAKGASLVSEMLYNALLTEYDKFNELFY